MFEVWIVSHPTNSAQSDTPPLPTPLVKNSPYEAIYWVLLNQPIKR